MRDPTRDIVRGLTALEMTVVNSSALGIFAHAPYIGSMTYADNIFPCFAFLSGMSPATPRKSVGLIGVGLALHSIQAAASGKKIRVPGVLQRLGIASLIFNAYPQQELALVGTAVWYAASVGLADNKQQPFEPASGSAQTKVDKMICGDRIYTSSYDPEGMLGNLTCALSMLSGYLFQSYNLSMERSVVSGLGMIGLSLGLHTFLPAYAPISKSLWTPTFVLQSTGVSILKYTAMEALIPHLPQDVRYVLSCVGRRTLETFILSTLVQMGLQYGSDSIWQRVKRALTPYIGEPAADFSLSAALAGIVGFAAVTMVKEGIRLSW